MFGKKKAKNRSLKQWTRPHRSRMRWRIDKFFESPLAVLKIILIVFAVLYFAGFAVAVSLDQTTANPVKMVQLVAGLMNSSETPSETESEKPSEEVPEETSTEETAPAETKPVESSAAESNPAQSNPAESTPAQSNPAESTPAQSNPAESTPAQTPAESSAVETSQAKDPSLATVFVDADIPVKIRSDAQIPLDDKTANIIAEVDAKADLQVRILGDAGESNGYKWSKIELVEDLKASDYVKISDGVLIKKGTVCYVCTRYLKKNQ